MLETSPGNFMMIQGYIQSQKVNLKVKFMQKCVIQFWLENVFSARLNFNFSGTKCDSKSK